MKSVSTLFLLLGSFFLVSCDEPAKEAETSGASGPKSKWSRKDWPVARGGAGLSGQVGDPVLKNPKKLWSYETEGPIAGEAVSSQGLVAFGNDLGWLHVLDLQTGEPKWKKEFEDSIEAAPAIFEDTLFIGCQDTYLYALDLSTGEEKWKIQTNEKITAGVNITPSPDGTTHWVVLNGYDGACRALDARTGDQIWMHQTEEYINGSPAIVDGKWIVFGGCDRILYTLDLATGKPVKQIETEAEIVSTVATEGTCVAWGNYGNEVLAADVTAGKTTWTYTDRKFPFMSAPAIDKKRVYIGCRDKKIHAISRAEGNGLWKYKTGGRVESSPLLFTDALVCGSSDGRLYAIDIEKGEEIWKVDLGESIIAAPSFANGILLVGSEDGTLFALSGE